MTSNEFRETEEEEEVRIINEDPVEDGSSHSSMPFPSLRDDPATDNNDLSTSPDSNITSSDKLSALPPSMASPSPNPNNRAGRSPMFRHSLDASRSWPSIYSSFAGLSPKLPDAGTGTWNRPRASTSEGSINLETTHRASIESDRTSLPTVQSVRQAFHRLHRGSDPTSPSPALRQWSQGIHHRPHAIHQEEPFVPVDPFKSHFHFSLNISFSLPDWYRRYMPGNAGDAEGLPMKTHDTESRPIPAVPYPNNHRIVDHSNTGGTAFDIHVHKPGHVHQTMDLHMMRIFFFDTLPRVTYLHILLRIPSMYFSRREVSKPDIQRMIDACGRGGSHFSNPLGPGPANDNANNVNAYMQQNATNHPFNINNNILNPAGPGIGPTSTTNLAAAAAASVVDLPLPLPEEWTAPLVSPSLIRFKLSWEAFIDSLMREWKTLNVVSALLLSAILTMFQINDAATDPITRTAALLSLVCAIMSLSYGCIFIVRFGTMRSMYRASIWAEEAQKTKTLVWWNVWVLLAMPAVWMSWSMIFFIVSIISFVWRTGGESDPPERSPLSDRAVLGPRIAVTFIFFLGMMYFFLIVRTLQSYGSNGFGPRERTRVYIEAQRREVPPHGNDAHETSGRRRRSTDASGTMGDRVKELRSQPTTDAPKTPERGGRHAVDVVVEIMRGDPDERDRRQPPLRRPLFGLGLTGAGMTQSEVDLEKGVAEHFDGEELL
ncbi:hypothetical protein BT96DRAFT_930075 [Gymnopus androsaceus JB14]|uniref:Uncharacterized protein n=1 Tax=Gymnopus androsaceus JB14 TaxID=1447944 RepID=A0A6A4GBT7_9AGAR|nr:hypothetical protein BT96DRAFT_930075 [Gymnopus androsaceus JB14]